MKKKSLLLLLAVAVAMAAFVVGCGEDDATDTTGTTGTAATTTSSTASETTTPGGSSGGTVLRLAALDNENGYSGEAIKTFAAELEKQTEGRYTVEVGWSAAWGGPGEYFDQVTSGLVDIAYFIPTTMPGTFPESDVVALPWVLPNADIATKAVQALVEQGYAMDDGMDAVHFLNVHMGPGHIIGTSKKVSSIKDFAGMKTIVGGELQSAAVKKLGCTPVYFDQPEYYSALQKGTADAIYNPWIGVSPWQLHEVLNTVVETNIGNVFCAFIMNKDTYAEMSPEDQKIIDEIAAEYLTDLVVKGYEDVAAVGKDAFLAKGGTVLQLTDEELADLDSAFAPIWDDWLASMEAKGLPYEAGCDAMYNILKNLGVQHPAIGYQPSS